MSSIFLLSFVQIREDIVITLRTIRSLYIRFCKLVHLVDTYLILFDKIRKNCKQVQNNQNCTELDNMYRKYAGNEIIDQNMLTTTHLTFYHVVHCTSNVEKNKVLPNFLLKPLNTSSTVHVCRSVFGIL